MSEEEELPASPAPIGRGRVETPPPDEPAAAAGGTRQDEADGQNKVGATHTTLFRPGSDITSLPACADFCLLVYFGLFVPVNS